MISVILCTHNPRPDYLARVLEALRAQSLPLNDWELLVIDNRSDLPLAGRVEIGWHPHGRVLREERLGLTYARLRGLRESTGALLVFVDDDNVLAPDYLEKALEIFQAYPQVAAYNGSVTGEYETPPPPWFAAFGAPLCACSEIEQDVWAKLPLTTPARPFGAGLCLHRAVADRYAKLTQNDPRRQQLGRRGAELSSGEDIDMIWCAADLGFGFGRFARLKLTHLIPASRMSMDYLVRLRTGQAEAAVALSVIRPEYIPKRSRVKALLNIFRFLVTGPILARRFAAADFLGRCRAARAVRRIQSTAAPNSSATWRD
jgi:glycosyltransferase involved in cell wall biosynthesis